MKHVSTTPQRGIFKPLLQSACVQAATMILQPGQSSSDTIEDEHPKAEQWLFVIRGRGLARGKKRSVSLKAGSLLLIGKNEAHQITNTGRLPLVTINFYSPPAYGKDAEVRWSVK